MANDSLSGVALLTELGQWLQSQTTRYSYRIVFVPETIGAISGWHSNPKATSAAFGTVWSQPAAAMKARLLTNALVRVTQISIVSQNTFCQT